MVQGVVQQASLAQRSCHVLPTVRQALGGAPVLGREAGRATSSVARAGRAAAQRVRATVAEPPVLDSAATTFPRGAHWQVRMRRRLPPPPAAVRAAADRR